MHSLRTVSCALLLNSSLAFAGVHNGFYVAADIGAAGIVDKEVHSFNYETHQFGALGLIGGGFIGYRHCLSELTGLGLEFFADATDLNARILHNAQTTSQIFVYRQKQRYDIGLRLLPEYHFTPTTSGHVILGYVNGGFNIADDGVYGYVERTYNKSGFQSGLGFTTCINDNFLMRLDGIYNVYSTQTDIGPSLTPGAIQEYTNGFGVLVGQLSIVYSGA